MNIEQLKRKIIDCRKCDRLVQFREKIALEKEKHIQIGNIGVSLCQDLVLKLQKFWF